jgi:hypothetical protein
MSIDCLFDTNCLVKRYIREAGTDVVDYLFEKSPTAVINIPNIQIIEVIKAFYKLRFTGEIKTDLDREKVIDTFLNDIKIGKIKIYDFSNEHLKDFDVYEPVVRIQPDPRKRRANTIDTILLIIMREMHLMTAEEAYLVSADDHVLDVAAHLKLKTLNPERISIANLPSCLDQRNKRVQSQVRTILKELTDKQCLGTGCTMNISQGGMAIRKQSRLTPGKAVGITLTHISKDEHTLETSGEVVWTNRIGVGMKFHNTIHPNVFSQLIQA